MTETTQKYKTTYWILFSISILLNFLPLIVYIIKGYASIEVSEARKVTLTMTMMIALILSIYNILAKKHMRSVIWILLLGVYFALQKIELLLLIMAICTIIDEFIVEPLMKKYKLKWKTNYEIDSRLEDIKAYVKNEDV